MLLGLCLAAYGGKDLHTALTAAGRHGELRLDVPTDSTLGLIDPLRCATDDEYLTEVHRALAGVAVECVSNSRDAQLLLGPHDRHTDPVRAGTVEEKRAHARDCATGAIRLAERIGAPTVRLLPGCPDFGRWLSWWGSDVSWSDNIAVFGEQMEPIVLRAREAGVRILLEPHPKQVVYDRTSVELLLAATVPWHDVLGLCVDPANLAAAGHDPVAAVRGWGSYLVAVHAKDLQRADGATQPSGAGWTRYGPQPPIRFRALGLGGLDWPSIVAALQDEHFDGVLYVEHEDTLLPRDRSIERSLGLLRGMVPDGVPEGRTW